MTMEQEVLADPPFTMNGEGETDQGIFDGLPILEDSKDDMYFFGGKDMFESMSHAR
jgi:hypothetical protein